MSINKQTNEPNSSPDCDACHLPTQSNVTVSLTGSGLLNIKELPVFSCVSEKK